MLLKFQLRISFSLRQGRGRDSDVVDQRRPVMTRNPKSADIRAVFVTGKKNREGLGSKLYRQKAIKPGHWNQNVCPSTSGRGLILRMIFCAGGVSKLNVGRSLRTDRIVIMNFSVPFEAVLGLKSLSARPFEENGRDFVLFRSWSDGVSLLGHAF